MKDTIRDLVDKWNPIGVEGLPDDEYDCLVEKIDLWMRSGYTENDLAFLIDNELQEHFSLEIETEDLMAFVGQLLELLDYDKTR
jgi:hypothetical protein